MSPECIWQLSVVLTSKNLDLSVEMSSSVLGTFLAVEELKSAASTLINRWAQ